MNERGIMHTWRLFLLLGLLLPSAGLAQSVGTLDGSGNVLRWGGARFVNTILPLPELCGDLALEEASTGTRCDERGVTVNAPSGFWSDNPGGLEVSIRWEDEAEDVDLYVYGPNDELAVSSTGFGSKSESVLVRAPANGDYRIVVVPASASDTAYEGLTELETTFPTKQGDLLPNLIALPPTDFHFAIGAYTLTPFDSEGAAGVSCYPEEIAEGARKCLRFDAGAENEGPGRFEIQIDLGTLAGERKVEQAIVRSDGGPRFCPAGHYSVHPLHGHVHYRAFTRYDIYPAAGRDGLRSSKAGFCLIDGEHRRFDGETQGNEPRTGAFPDCNLPSEITKDGNAPMVQGISRGWADIYAWPLPGQFIEVSDLADGAYIVAVTANPDCQILETDYGDNVACTEITIAGNTVSEVGAAPCPDFVPMPECAPQGSPACPVVTEDVPPPIEL